MLRKDAKLGGGTYGIVYKVTTEEGESYALKRNLAELDQLSEAIRELDILNRLRGHPRIITIKMVTTKDALVDNDINSPLKVKGMRDDVFHFLFELAESDLENWTQTHKLSLRQYKQFMVDILLGVEFITSSGIIHRDLKPGNIVVFRSDQENDSNDHSPNDVNLNSETMDSPTLPDEFNDLYRLKICDFGLATPITLDDNNTPGVYTPWYRAPEVIGRHTDYNEKADYWAVGCIFYELLFKIPFCGKCNTNDDTNIARALIRRAHYSYDSYEIKEVLNYRGEQSLPNPPKTIYQQMINKPEIRSMIIAEEEDYKPVAKSISEIITGLLQINPNKRWSATTALDHSFFDEYRDYIEQSRESCGPRYAYQHIYDILDVPERRWISEYITKIYNDKDDYSWYTHKRMFHAIDMFDRVLRYEKKKIKPTAKRIRTKEGGHIMSNLDAEIYFFSCLHIAISMFGTLTTAVDITEVIPKHLGNNKKYIAKLKAAQLYILKDVFKYKIYRYTIYEAIYGTYKGDREYIELIFYYAIIKLSSDYKSINGLQPTDLAKEVIDMAESDNS